MRKDIEDLEERVKKLSRESTNRFILTQNELHDVDETGIPPEQLTPLPEEDWVKQHRLELEAQRDAYLARQNPEDVTATLKEIREWFPGELTENGERTATYLFHEALERATNDEDAKEIARTLPGWIFSVIPEVDKTRKGLVHQYRIATAANKVLE